MRAVIAHDSAVEGLRTWELIEADRYYHDRYWGQSVSGRWASGRVMRHMAFPLKFVEVVA